MPKPLPDLLEEITADWAVRYFAGAWLGGFRRPNRVKYAVASPPIRIAYRPALYKLDPLIASTDHVEMWLEPPLIWFVVLPVGRN